MNCAACPLILVCCSCLGCNGAAPTAPHIDLAPPTAVVISDLAIVTASVPQGMMITREVPLHSRFETPITNIRSISSCGCTSVELDHDVIAPRGMTTLRCVYDGGSIAKSQNVRVNLYSPDIPAGPFVLDLRFETDPAQAAFQIVSSPNKILIDEPWRASHRQEHACTLSFGNRVPRESVTVATSANFISAKLHKNLLTIAMDSPATGSVDEYVTVSFPNEKGTFALRIPIKGNIHPPLKASPKFINFGDVARESDMAGEILFEGIDELKKTDIEVTGDWQAQSLERVNGQSWRLRICAKPGEGSDNRYGNILVKGTWPGKPIKIPLTGRYRNP